MAAAAAIVRRRSWTALTSSSSQIRELSELAKSNGNGKRAFLVDTLGLVRRLEGQGVPSKQTEAITSAITEVLNDSLENVSQSFVSNGRMQMSEMVQDANLSKFKSEVQSLQEHHFSLLQRKTEKLKTDIEKMRSELRFSRNAGLIASGVARNLNRTGSYIKEIFNDILYSYCRRPPK